jgi:hypothetical protein
VRGGESERRERMKLEDVLLEGVVVGKPVYALCQMSQKTKRLKALKYAMTVSGGNDPLWGVWSIKGVFQRYHHKRSGVEEANPNMVWRRLSLKLTSLTSAVDQPAEKERTQIIGYYDQVSGKVRSAPRSGRGSGRGNGETVLAGQN